MQGSSNFRNGQKQPYHKLFLMKGIHEQMIKWPLKGHYHGWSLKFLFSNFLSMLPNARINFIKRSHTGGVAKIFFFFGGGGAHFVTCVTPRVLTKSTADRCSVLKLEFVTTYH